MRKTVAALFMSLDGVVESPSRWARFDDELTEMMAAGIARADAILLGRHTYLEFAGLWPGQPAGVPMVDFMNNTPKYVVSRTLKTLDWANSSLITSDLAGEVGRLKALPGKNIQIPGSPSLVRSMLRGGLLDELSLGIQPVVVGSGMRLFDGVTDRVDLTLIDSTTLRSGVVNVTYAPAVEM